MDWHGLLARTRALFFRLASGPKRYTGLSKRRPVPDSIFLRSFSCNYPLPKLQEQNVPIYV